MRALLILKQTLSPMLQTIHLVRLQAVFWAVQSLLVGGRLSLTHLGRSGANRGIPKHSIKRADRLLGNKNLHKETPVFYRAIAHTLLKSSSRPIILLDWTRIEPKHVALVAAVPLDGRSIPIYLEVHHEEKDTNPKVMKDFLKKLKQILPKKCRPILVTDAGFKTGWFKRVQEMGWDFVGRLRGTVDVCREENKEWRGLGKLYRFARSTPCDLGQWKVTRKNKLSARIIAYRKRKRWARPEPSIGSAKLKRRRKNIEPWLLATSLNERTAKQITKMYSKRMQIEETFRDAKNHRFGWSFRHARSNSVKRYEVLLLIAAIAMLAATLLGNAAEKQGLHFKYQANTIRTRRVLSLFFLGIALMKEEDNKTLLREEILNSLKYLAQLPERIDD